MNSKYKLKNDSYYDAINTVSTSRTTYFYSMIPEKLATKIINAVEDSKIVIKLTRKQLAKKISYDK